MLNMRKLLIALSQLALLAGFSMSAHATLITFDGLGVNTDDPLTVDGFTFDYQDRNGFAVGIAGVTICCSLNNGTDALLIRDTIDFDMTILMTDAGGNAFSLNSLDIFDAHVGGGDMEIVITGLLSGGGSVLQTLSTIADTFSNVSLTGFNDLASVSIQGTGSGGLTDAFQIDNVLVNAVSVPESGTLSLLGAGLLGLGMMRRRRRAA